MAMTLHWVSRLQHWSRKHGLRLGLHASFMSIGMLSMLGRFGLLLPLALVPLIIYTKAISKLKRSTVLVDFYLGGVIISLFAFVFIVQLAPQNWTVFLHGWMSYVTRGFALVAISLFGGLSFLLFGFLLTVWPRFTQRLVCLLLAWPLAEVLRSYLVALLSYGPGGSLSPNYNFGSLAVTAAGTPLVYLSRIVGFYGLSLVILLCAIALYFLIVKRSYLLPSLALIVIVALCTFSWHLGNGSTPRTIRVASVHLATTSNLKNWPVVSLPEANTDLLVLPEYSEFEKNIDKDQLLSRLSADGIAVTSVAVGNSPTAANRLRFYARNGAVAQEQDKTLLIPTGEYLPYVIQIFLKVTGQQTVNESFTDGQQIAPGAGSPQAYRGSKVTYGALVCSGVLSLTEYRDLTKQGSDILTNSASLSFLSNSSFYYRYARNMARFQAVSNDRPLVQSSRGGESFIMDRQGKIITLTSGDKNALIQAVLPVE